MKRQIRNKTIILAILALGAASCEDRLTSEPVISATAEASVPEYERPVVHVSRSEATDMFIPCQAVIDGSPVTILNAAGTTLLNMPSQDIRLPRLAPGRHEVELVFGKARRLYRDAEAACGERESSAVLSVEVTQSDRNVLVLTAPRTDIDRYIFTADDGKAVDANTGEGTRMSDMKILADTYTVRTYPSARQEKGFAISGVGEKLRVEKTETLIGKGIGIGLTGSSSKDKEASMFTLTAGGREYVIQVAG